MYSHLNLEYDMDEMKNEDFQDQVQYGWCAGIGMRWVIGCDGVTEYSICYKDHQCKMYAELGSNFSIKCVL